MNTVLNEARLNEMLTTPSQRLLEDVAKIKGDIMILGAGGKMGPTLSLLA
ncbi:MAG: epimerase, partial [Clostridia bacterium]|nr:epimerase [Clostridia bacterium]